ncbi:MAG: hypothetical protein N2593_00975, partial [Patescibacteria group bacterium]|nr:hypothetical protein [Patescibacteria group bacterium]
MKKKNLKKLKKACFEIKKFLNKILIIFFVFFISSQFGKHFFPEFSYINGIRVDYLSPTIYLIDILTFTFFVLNFKNIFIFFKNKKIIIFFIFLTINILFSKNQIISLYQFLRIIELFIVFFIGNQIFKIIKEKTFLKILLISSLF